MVARVSGRERLLMPMQDWKACDPTDVTDAGRVSSVRPVQPLNALGPISVILSPMVSDRSDLQPENIAELTGRL